VSGSRRWTGNGHPVVAEYLREPLNRLGRRRSGHGRQVGVGVAGRAVGDEELLKSGRSDEQEKPRGVAANSKRMLAARWKKQRVVSRHDRVLIVRPTVEVPVENEEGLGLPGVPVQGRAGAAAPGVLDERETACGVLAGESHTQAKAQMVVGIARGRRYEPSHIRNLAAVRHPRVSRRSRNVQYITQHIT
jgi:hypothetical protein